jgi:hypothetical protein
MSTEIKAEKGLFCNENILREYHEYKGNTKKQEDLLKKINWLKNGIYLSSFVVTPSGITASVIVIGGVLKAFVLSKVLMGILAISSVLFFVALIVLIISMSLFYKNRSEKALLDSKISKEPFLPIKGSYKFNEIDEKYPNNFLGSKFAFRDDDRRIKEIYGVVKRLYEDIYLGKKYEIEKKEEDLKYFNEFRKKLFVKRFSIRNSGPKNCSKYQLFFDREKEEIFNKDISEIINSNRTYEEKIELIEFHPMITIGKCLEELYYIISDGVFKDFYVGIFNRYIEDFKDDTKFYNAFVIKRFEMGIVNPGYCIKSFAKIAVKHIKSEKQMEYILTEIAFIRDEEWISGHLKRKRIDVNDIIEALKKAWQEKTKEKI